MSRTRVVLRARAQDDVADVVTYYLAEEAHGSAARFVDALELAVATIASHPALGSPRIGHELELPGLCSWPVSGFPYLIFYVDAKTHIDVWRVLHAKRDLPAWLRGAP